MSEIDAVTGDALWITGAKTIGVSVSPNRVLQKEDGNIVWGGSFVGAVAFGDDTLTSRSNEDMWVSQLDSSGNYQWVDFIVGRPSSSIERIQALAEDPAGNIYFGGYFEGRLEYPGDTVFSRGGISDGFFAKLGSPGCFVCPSASADFIYSDSFLEVSFDAGNSMSADSFIWDFDDGTGGNGQTTSHFYSLAGSYTVCLIARSDCDADTFCQQITVADSMVGINPINDLITAVYPNPSRDGVFTVRGEPGLESQIRVLDLSGREIKKVSSSSTGQTTIDLEDSRGVYILQIETNQGLAVHKLVVGY